MFEGRDLSYVGGSVVLVVATGVSLAGTLCPGWMKVTVNAALQNITSQGLFIECSQSETSACRAVNLMEIQGFEMWSHVIISMGVVSLFVSSFFIFLFNCGTGDNASRLKVVEGFGVYGGFFILIGIINYVANDTHKPGYSYGYAFFLTVLSSLLAVTGGALVALSNRKSRYQDHVAGDVEEGEEQEEEEEGEKGGERASIAVESEERASDDVHGN